MSLEGKGMQTLNLLMPAGTKYHVISFCRKWMEQKLWCENTQVFQFYNIFWNTCLRRVCTVMRNLLN